MDGACEARAAIYASLPPLSRAPCEPYRFYQIVTDMCESCLANAESLPSNREKTVI